ncbi:winged helix-turn-helix transcriptional regulator [Paracoccus aminovorans]|uniref:winged helix-turn-helix transcriptional regulator n=1 Tax=Paracoccus aminovorans TaxID=34004 RepID=UPI00078369EA|nr:helix-turn-helix domain-containing protein [Paracoccus aminovorans]MDQ7776376.1 helix-turn-helix domain-containing protein [Paracoccus aminovorans]
MSKTGKTLRYDEGCLGAHALNLVGDRWALLVVRELMFAPKRFQMIRAGLPGVTASVLTQRLGQLVQAGVVSHDEVLGLYALTEQGRALHPVLRELCRWALLMPGHDPRRFISISALMISISATVDAGRAAGSNLRAGFLSGKEGFEVILSPKGAPLVTAMRAPQGDFLLEGSGNALAAAIYGPGPVTIASAGLIGLHGDRAAAQAFTDLFRLKP